MTNVAFFGKSDRIVGISVFAPCVSLCAFDIEPDQTLPSVGPFCLDLGHQYDVFVIHLLNGND